MTHEGNWAEHGESEPWEWTVQYQWEASREQILYARCRGRHVVPSGVDCCRLHVAGFMSVKYRIQADGFAAMKRLLLVK